MIVAKDGEHWVEPLGGRRRGLARNERDHEAGIELIKQARLTIDHQAAGDEPVNVELGQIRTVAES